MDAIVTIVGGYFLGDFFTGIFHWWEDRYARLEWPILGDLVAKANIEHHQYPMNTCYRSYWYRNGAVILATLPAFVLCLYLGWYMVAVGFAVMSQGSETHMWAHKRMNRVIRWIQRTELLLSPRAHADHHHRPYSDHYCTVTNWLNPLLTHLRFWRAAEWIVRVFFRVPVNVHRSVY